MYFISFIELILIQIQERVTHLVGSRYIGVLIVLLSHGKSNGHHESFRKWASKVEARGRQSLYGDPSWFHLVCAPLRHVALTPFQTVMVKSNGHHLSETRFPRSNMFWGVMMLPRANFQFRIEGHTRLFPNPLEVNVTRTYHVYSWWEINGRLVLKTKQSLSAQISLHTCSTNDFAQYPSAGCKDFFKLTLNFISKQTEMTEEKVNQIFLCPQMSQLIRSRYSANDPELHPLNSVHYSII